MSSPSWNVGLHVPLTAMTTHDAVIRALLAAFIAHMSGADFFGLVVAVIVVAYLFYALIRGERL